MTIQFNSVRNFNKEQGFKFRYQFENVGCGGVLTDPNGTISTINTRMTNTFCEWIIMVPDDKSVTLKYKQIEFGNNDRQNCSNGLYQFENFTRGDSIKTEYFFYIICLVF